MDLRGQLALGLGLDGFGALVSAPKAGCGFQLHPEQPSILQDRPCPNLFPAEGLEGDCGE